MKAITLKAAQRCESACTKRCKCRCEGKAHGRGKLAADASREQYESLPMNDPHNPIRKKQREIREHNARVKARNYPLQFPAPDEVGGGQVKGQRRRRTA
ncbi:MAG: hypothetical protein JWO13_803 [Acidobacteriales bacterium]|nr:hypothetical protein [Terriglobales bacterium]